MKSNHIKSLHVELTSACNAACPLCFRTNSRYRYNQDFKNIDVLLSNLDLVLDKLQYVYFCGNVGDPLASQHLLTVLKHLRKNPLIKLSVHTNGGLRNPAYFEQLAELTDRVVFAVDGLETTNHLYRVGVDWNKLMANIRAFVGSGGIAEWHYLVFEHNVHELEQAQRLSHDLRVDKFVSKKAHRFKMQNGNPLPLHMNNQYGQYSILPSGVDVQYDNMNNSYDTCPTEARGELYIDYMANVLPCCFTGIGLLKILQDEQSAEPQNLMQVIENLQNISLNNHNILDIVDSPTFDRLYHYSQMRKIHICNRVCFKK